VEWVEAIMDVEVSC